MRRARAAAAVLLAVTFATGGLAGMAVEEALGLDWFDFLDEDGRGDARLLAGLSLTAAQRGAVDDILDRQERQLEGYWASRLGEMRGIVARSHDEIREVLTPEQRIEFDRRLAAVGGAEPTD